VNGNLSLHHQIPLALCIPTAQTQRATYIDAKRLKANGAAGFKVRNWSVRLTLRSTRTPTYSESIVLNVNPTALLPRPRRQVGADSTSALGNLKAL